MSKQDMYQCEYCDSTFTEYRTSCPHCGGVSWKMPSDITVEDKQENTVQLQNIDDKPRAPEEALKEQYEDNRNQLDKNNGLSGIKSAITMFLWEYDSVLTMVVLIVMILGALLIPRILLSNMEEIMTDTYEHMELLFENQTSNEQDI